MAFDMWVTVALGLALCSITLSFYAISKHMLNFTKPYLQRYIIRILLMVPIYSMNAWIAMVIPSTGLYLDSFREIYESFVIYSFMKYLFNFLHYDTNLQQYIAFKPGPRHVFPLCCLPACVGGNSLLLRCKHGILQYVVVRPLTTLIAFVSQVLGFYGEGQYNPLSGYAFPVLLLVNNASQVIAMYCLVIFYTGYRQELAPMNPLAKFFSIKLVVFFSFFQSVLVSALIEVQPIYELLHELFPELNDKVQLGRKVQEFLICIDMLIASIGHQFAFPHWPFVDDDDEQLIGVSAGGPDQNNNNAMRGCCANNSDDSTNDGHHHQHHDRTHLFRATRNMPLYQSRHAHGSAGAVGEPAGDWGASQSLASTSVMSKGGRSYREAMSSLFDFSDEKSDVSEHFMHLFTRLRSFFGLFNPLRYTLPAVVTAEGVTGDPSSIVVGVGGDLGATYTSNQVPDLTESHQQDNSHPSLSSTVEPDQHRRAPQMQTAPDIVTSRTLKRRDSNSSNSSGGSTVFESVDESMATGSGGSVMSERPPHLAAPPGDTRNFEATR